MPRTIVKRIKVYKFNELSEKSKVVARNWYSEGIGQDDWWESIYRDAENIGLCITGFELGHTIQSRLTHDAEEICRLIFADHGDQCDTYQFALKWTVKFLTGDHEDLDFHKGLERIYLQHLQAEWDYLNSNESIDENILCNEYEFTKDGKRYVV